MKSFAAILLAGCVLATAAHAAPLRTERLWLFGKDYYRLDDWARANGMQMRWLGKKDVQVSNGSNRLLFTGDSRVATIDGTSVWLGNDVVVKNGVAYITPLDVASTIGPLLWPARAAGRKQVRHICLDAGHGGKDVGEHDGREQEKKYTLLLAQELGDQLRKAGYTVSFTRSSDVYVELADRASIARSRGADLFISLHFNSFRRSDVHGVETYCLTPRGAHSSNDGGARGNTGSVTGNQNDARNLLLAYNIHKAILKNGGSDDRGVRRARYEVLRMAEMPAVLIESGYMTNTAEGRKIYSAAWRRQIAQAIVTGVRGYRNFTER